MRSGSVIIQTKCVQDRNQIETVPPLSPHEMSPTHIFVPTYKFGLLAPLLNQGSSGLRLHRIPSRNNPTHSLHSAID